jgi:predicted transcriptional regulator
MLPKLPSIQEQLLNIANNLSEDATWDDVLESVSTCQAIERGLADIAAGRTIPHDQVREYLAQRRRERETSVE